MHVKGNVYVYVCVFLVCAFMVLGLSFGVSWAVFGCRTASGALCFIISHGEAATKTALEQ